MVEFNPTHEVREDVDVVWQIPPNPKAVLYLAHSSNGSPFSYWPPHPNVPQCTGTPEHKVLVKQALERGFAVIAGKSVTHEWETWPPSTVDIQKGVKILKAWRAEHGLEDLPLSAWGTSCGGDFVSSLAIVVKMHSLIVMISQGHPEAFKAAVAGEYPATLFVPMIKDEKTFSKVKQNVEILNSKGIPSAIVEAPPFKVHPHFFAEHIDELDEEQSAKLHSLFVEHGVVAEDHSVNKMVLQHDVEPYLRVAGILPTVDDDEHQRDEDKLNLAKKLHLEGGSMQGGGGPGRGGPPHGGPPHEGPPHEGPPHGGRGGGRRPPPGGHGEHGSPPHDGPPHEGPPHGGRVGGHGPPPGGRGRHGGPPHDGPPHGGRVGGRGPPSGGRGEHGGPPHDGPPHEGPPHGGRVGGRGPPPGGRGRHGGPPHDGPPHGGRVGGRGPPPGGRGRGGPPRSHPLAHGVSNQLMVAQGDHTLTSRHNSEIFNWLEGKGWPNAHSQ